MSDSKKVLRNAIITTAVGLVGLYLWSRYQGQEEVSPSGGGYGAGSSGYDTDGDGIVDTYPDDGSGGGADGGSDPTTPPSQTQDPDDPAYDPFTADGDGDGIPDAYDDYYGPGTSTDQYIKAAENGAGSGGDEGGYSQDDSWKPGFFDTTVGQVALWTGVGAATSAAGAGVRAAYTRYRYGPQGPAKSTTRSPTRPAAPKTLRGPGARPPTLRGPGGKFVSPKGLLNFTPPKPSLYARVGGALETRGATVASGVQKTGTAILKGTGTALTRARAAVPLIDDVARVAGRAAPAVTTITRAAAPVARIAGRAAGPIGTAVMVVPVAKNVYETGRALVKGDMQDARHQSSQVMQRGIQGLSLGAVNYRAESSSVAILGKDFKNVDAPNSFAEAGRNVKTNLGSAGNWLAKQGSSAKKKTAKWSPFW